MVTGGRVKVLYGLRVCRPLEASGRIYAGLMGDRACHAWGLQLPPKFFMFGEVDDGPDGYKNQYKAHWT